MWVIKHIFLMINPNQIHQDVYTNIFCAAEVFKKSKVL